MHLIVQTVAGEIAFLVGDNAAWITAIRGDGRGVALWGIEIIGEQVVICAAHADAIIA